MKPKLNTSCINCGEMLHGKYCSSCGLKQITPEDKKIKHFLSEFFTSLFFADGKILSTLKVILTKPGELTRTYISGNRKKYIAPLQLFFFANLIYFLFPVLSTFNTNLSAQIKGQLYSSIVKEVVRKELIKEEISYQEYRDRYEAKSSENGKLLLITLVLLQAAAFNLLFLKSKTFYFTDFLAASAYFNAIYILVLLVFLPSMVILIDQIVGLDFNVFNDEVLSVTFIGLLVVYLVAYIKNAFQISIKSSILRSIALSLFLIPSFVIYRFILFWATYWSV